ncbi:unnamed protein product [Lactuca virosa]|uniref:W2 domain-containing protein n=1 Tax=Lactuca virosa TaxID=75947 RepID=A0AAU9M4Q0_9ASTR|nr:unnamed protein product [Lactuca virosa]
MILFTCPSSPSFFIDHPIYRFQSNLHSRIQFHASFLGFSPTPSLLTVFPLIVSVTVTELGLCVLFLGFLNLIMMMMMMMKDVGDFITKYILVFSITLFRFPNKRNDGYEFFEKEVEETFRRGVDEKLKDENIIFEVQSLRLSHKMDLDKCVGALFYSMMKLALDTWNTSSGENDLLKKTKDVISQWGKLLKWFLRDIDVEIEVILKFEEMCLESAKAYAPLFMEVLRVLYDKDIIQEDAIKEWKEEKKGADESDRVFVEQSQKFLKLLKAANEE